MTKICIYGCGMFGFALAKHFGDKFEKNPKYEIISYDRKRYVVDHINETKCHPYHFTHIKLSDKNKVTNDIYSFIDGADILILAVPSQSIRDVTNGLKRNICEDVIIVNTAKALECKTDKRLSEVINEYLPNNKIAHFSGGTIAQDLVNGAPLGAEIACEDIQTCNMLQILFSNERLRVYPNLDIVGVEYAGAFKNIIAILAGIISGMGLPYGSETHFISMAAKDAKHAALCLGAKEHTFSMESQSWGNDLWMSCTGNTRNRRFGGLIGEGANSANALDTLKKEHKLVEGYYTAKSIPNLCSNTNYDSFILMQIYEILYNNKKCSDAINDIMTQELISLL